MYGKGCSALDIVCPYADRERAGAILPAAQHVERYTTVNITEIQTAVLSSQEAAAALAIAAQAAVEGKAQIDKGKAKGAAAESVMICGFADDSAAAMPWAFDIKAGDDVHTYVETVGYTEHGTETAPWVLNGQGKVSKIAQGAYKRGFHVSYFALSEPVPAVWTMVNRALPIASAIREEGMTARIEAGALKLEGGTSERAAAMRDAKSLAALRKAVAGTSGTNRTAPQNDGEGEGEGEAAPVVMSRTDTLRAALAILNDVICGDGKGFTETEAAIVKGMAKVTGDYAKAEAAAEKAEKAEAARKAARNA